MSQYHHNPETRSDQKLKERRVHVVAARDINWPLESEWQPSRDPTDINQVQESYRWAHQQGLLQSSLPPTAFVHPVWHPMRLEDRGKFLEGAVLKRSCIDSIVANLDKVTAQVPRSHSWHDTVQKRQLTPPDILEIINLAKGVAPAHNSTPGPTDGTLTSLISRFRSVRGSIRQRQGLDGWAARLARLIEYSLIHIREYQAEKENARAGEVGTRQPAPSKVRLLT